MPANLPAISPNRAPKASRKKIWVHTFYLVQPIVQFFALVLVMLVFARCSPLAPSTDRVSGAAGAPGPGNSEQAEAAAMEQDILSNMKELNTAALEVISEDESEDLASKAIHADNPFTDAGLRLIYNSSGMKRAGRKVLFVPLSPDQQIALFRDGHIRLPLSERLKIKSQERPTKSLLGKIQHSMEQNDLSARAYLVLPNATVRQSPGEFDKLNIPLKISLSIPTDDRAYLEIIRLEDQATLRPDNAALLGAALDEALQLAILLE